MKPSIVIKHTRTCMCSWSILWIGYMYMYLIHEIHSVSVSASNTIIQPASTPSSWSARHLGVTRNNWREFQYCPQQCTCTNRLQFPLINSSYNYNISCSIKHGVFPLSDEMEQIIEKFTNPQINFALFIRCYNGSSTSVLWDGNNFLRRTTLLSVQGCRLQTGQERVVLPPDSPLKEFMMREMTGMSDFFKNIISLEGFINLRNFLCDNCGLTEIPEVLYTVRSMNVTSAEFKLSLKQNRITTLDCRLLDAVAEGNPSIVTTKVYVYLNRNNIKEFRNCQCSTDTGKLWTLSLGSNNLHDYTDILCLSLRHLTLTFNEITHLPRISMRHTKIVTFDAGFNKITHVPSRTFARLRWLQDLDLSYNQIKYIETGAFKRTGALAFVKLNNNLLTTYDSGHLPLGAPYYRTEVFLQNNKLLYPPLTDVAYMPSQRIRISAENNPYRCDCSLETFLYYIKKPNKDLMWDSHMFKCASPKQLSGVLLSKVSVRPSCAVFKHCPAECECLHSVDNGTTHVNCSQRGIQHLPEDMPHDVRLDVDLSHNNITELTSISNRQAQYLQRILSLDLSQNKIWRIRSSAMVLLAHVSNLDLADNVLKMLPGPNTLSHQLTRLTLHGNPWSCTCETLWFTDWIQGNLEKVSDHDTLYCTNKHGERVSIVNVSVNNLGCVKYNFASVAISLGILCLVIITVAVLLHKYRLEVKVLMYTRLNLGWFDPPRENRDKLYDAFVSYSEDDLPWIKNTLIHVLEQQHQPPYRLCIHDRDFLIGAPIAENIIDGIQNSHVSIFYITPGFLQSQWCKFQFHTAHQMMLNQRTVRIVTIVTDNLPDDLMSPDLQSYVSTHTYLHINHKFFWDKLKYALPKPPEERTVNIY